jgi:hypothetical protein
LRWLELGLGLGSGSGLGLGLGLGWRVANELVNEELLVGSVLSKIAELLDEVVFELLVEDLQ